MKSYPITLAGLRRDLPLCRVTDDLYIAAFVIFGDAPLTVACADALLAKAPPYDYLITAEAKGIPLAHEMAQQRGDDHYFIARKSPKRYMQRVIQTHVKSMAPSGEQALYLDQADADLIRGKRILLVDDVVSTGESLSAIEHLVQQAGGAVAGRMCILAEGAAQHRDDLVYLAPLPVFNADGTEKV
jgi:adenine phosphoribosyltransferase